MTEQHRAGLRCLNRVFNFQMISGPLSAQRRPARSLPDDRNLQKTSTYIVPCFLFVELVIMAGTVLLAYYFEYTDTFPVHVQGFFCFDKAYSKPYPGPEDNSKAPPVLVYSLVTAIPTVTILIGEVTSFFVKTEGAQEKTIVTADCCYFNPLPPQDRTFSGCLLLRPLHDHHLCQRRSSGDRKPDASFPVRLQTKLHRSGLPVSAAVHHRPPSLHRKPVPDHVRPEIFPLQRRSAQLLFSHLHSGEELFRDDR
ncbi:Phospholipid phosphatase-related protein type 1, partial [Larimichthys crocea]